MKLEMIYILFWLYSCLGWIMETTLVSIQSKKFVNRGFFLGPYCPIYGTGGIFLLTLKNYQSDPLVVFVLAIFICSIVEYITSYLLELIYKVRWWDYSNRFFNINGRICLFNSICFGLLGMLMVCFLNPFFIKKISSLSPSLLFLLTIAIFIVTLCDMIITTSIMFDIRKTVVDFKERTFTNLFKPNTDNTEEVSKKVRSILKEKSFIHKHLSKAYSNLKVYKNNFFHKKEEGKQKKKESLENIFIVSSLLSILLGFLIGKMVENIGLSISVCFVLNLIIVHLLNRSSNDKK